MGDRRDPARDQALPRVNDNPYIQDLVIADIAERKEHDITKYGTALQAGNGRDALRDLYEELLDGVMYVRQAMEERIRERVIFRADGAVIDPDCGLTYHQHPVPPQYAYIPTVRILCDGRLVKL
jgi:hypothetical protein